MAKPILNATLVKREHLTDTLDVLEFELEGGVPDFQPGQFVTLGLPDHDPDAEGKMLWRAYSIASAPSEKRHVELYVRWARTPVDRKLTTMLWKMPIGGQLNRVKVAIDEIRLINVGSGGVSMSQLTNVIIQAILAAVVQNAADLPIDLITDLGGGLAGLTGLGLDATFKVGGEVTALVGDVLGEVTKAVGGAGEDVGKEIGKALEGLGGLLGGDKQ